MKLQPTGTERTKDKAPDQTSFLSLSQVATWKGQERCDPGTQSFLLQKNHLLEKSAQERRRKGAELKKGLEKKQNKERSVKKIQSMQFISWIAEFISY